MAWLATDKDGSETVFEREPYKEEVIGVWMSTEDYYYIELPKGSIKKLIGRDLTWKDKPIEIK